MDVSKTVEGIPEEGKLLQTIRPRHERFRRAIRNTAPRFSPFERNTWRSSSSMPFLENEDGAETDGEDSLEHETEPECGPSEAEERGEDEYEDGDGDQSSVATSREGEYDEPIPEPEYVSYAEAPARPTPHPETIFIDEVMKRAHK